MSNKWFLVSLLVVFGSLEVFGQQDYATQSVLSTGTWYKMGLTETGVYKLSYSDLNSMGVDVSSINPQHIRVFHNGGGVLPELNRDFRYDDLQEIPVYVAGEADGRFDKDDYVLFYGRGPVTWKRADVNQDYYEHVQNAYDDYAYAFLTTSLGEGKRIQTAGALSAPTDEVVSRFIDYQVHEKDEYNLRNMGRSYFGDLLDGTAAKHFVFSFPNLVSSESCRIKSEFAGRCFSPSRFTLAVNGTQVADYPVSATTSTGDAYANLAGGKATTMASGDEVKLTLNFKAADNSAVTGYVDYLAVNAWRGLSFTRGQMAFRNPKARHDEKVYEYRLSNASSNAVVWNVSNPVSPHLVQGNWNGTTFSFKVRGNADNEFVAFDGSAFLSVKECSQAANQNLHGVRDVDFLIIAHPDFLSQAQRLKDIHTVQDPDVTCFITTPQEIYNEFSCGATDVSAIRDFCRMLYLDSDRPLKYLLLFGDASFDFKNRGDKTVCFVPAYESVSSHNLQTSYVTDDFFGAFGVDEGAISSSTADIGIGRFPVSTIEQAVQMVDKVENYLALNQSTMRPWRNVATFVTDDQQYFTTNSEGLINVLKSNNGENLVFDKIYLDAFEQIATPNGEMAPSVNDAINKRMEKGTLIFNYMGHGGEVQLCEERILQRKDVDSWRNGPMYPLMITGTCEFSRYDDHTRTSLGEYAFLNPYGGMVAMFTTSRVTFGSQNMDFITAVYRNLLRVEAGFYMRLGDVYRLAKHKGDLAEKRYVFFGDPLLRIAYPSWSVETLSINGHPMGSQDTISALQPVEIKGVVKDLSGQVATGFDGEVYVTVYDKAAHLTTANSDGLGAVPFELYNSVVFNGKATVEKGLFSVRFIVPRDIAYSFGKGMISYYATNYQVDANGKCEDFVIGGFYDDAVTDATPPAIDLYIDDVLFVSGGLTGENPTLLAYLEDESGINTTGAGIGHDIVATLVGADNVSYCLNDYFVSEPNQPGKGVIVYKMLGLPEGDYTLTLKAWDIYNNSNVASIDFTVVNSNSMKIDNAFNKPNPFTDVTYFTFDHNQIGNDMDVQIDIFDIMGRWVARLSRTVSGVSTRVEPIEWDGRAANGERLANGIYIYRITATNDKGETAVTSSKLVMNK